MSEKPILFSGEMVKAILAGRKTQTRRAIKPQPLTAQMISESTASLCHPGMIWRKCPYGQPGDRLWVRETFQFVHANSDGQRNTFNSHKPFSQHDYRWIEYAATPKDNEPPPKWKPSIFMPRWASRITLEITSSRVERLKDISNEDCFAEGLPADTTKGNRTWYGDLWEKINGKGSWDANPWVWVIEFKKVFNSEVSHAGAEDSRLQLERPTGIGCTDLLERPAKNLEKANKSGPK
jgi:hypothetical protein